jgi:hypothetical protein
MLTQNYAIPYAWLAANGYINNVESAPLTIGANHLPLWQSYVAGLNPNDPNSQLRLDWTRTDDNAAAANLLRWNTAPDRLYTLWWATNVMGPFSPLPGGLDLDSSFQSFTHGHAQPAAFYRLSVRKP